MNVLLLILLQYQQSFIMKKNKIDNFSQWKIHKFTSASNRILADVGPEWLCTGLPINGGDFWRDIETDVRFGVLSYYKNNLNIRVFLCKYSKNTSIDCDNSVVNGCLGLTFFVE